MKIPALLLLLSLVAAPARAQLVWSHEAYAEVLSNVMLVNAIVTDTVENAKEEDKKKAYLQQGLASGMALGIAVVLKNIIKDPRPCVPDCGIDVDYGMPSGHSALAFSSVRGWRYSFAISTAYLRVAAGKHSVKQVLAGAAVGIGSQHLARLIVR